MSTAGGSYGDPAGGTSGPMQPGPMQPGPAVDPAMAGQHPGYGYGPGWGPGRGFGPRRPFPIETKPFFLTSEFAALVIAILALLITTATDDSIDARMFWILTTVLISFYMLSRGIAKSGTKSRSFDPREQLLGQGGQGRD